MNVFFDYQIFYLQKYGGISRYFVELNKELNKIPGCSSKIVAPYHLNEYLIGSDTKTKAYSLNPIFKKVLYNRYVDKRILVNEQAARIACKLHKPSVLHETYYTNRFKINTPKVTTIHDMIYELFSNHTEEEKINIERKKKAILEADAIIAVSENTKKDLISLYPDVKNKTSVVYHGIKSIDDAIIHSFKNERPYILFVGNRDWYKNFSVLLEVYTANPDIASNFDLICFGGRNFTIEEQNLIDKYHLTSNVKLLKGSDLLLNQLYKGASVLAYLSKYEGFGFPVLEAMNFNCPVICSNGSSLPEVAGNFATLIDVSDKNEVERALKENLFHSDIDTRSNEKRKEWIRKFTWSKCASETIEVYKKLV